MSRQHESPIRRPLFRFLAVFLAMGAVLAGLFGVLDRRGSGVLFGTVQSQERYAQELQEQIIELEIQSVVRDLLFLAGQNELRALADTGSAEAGRELAREFLLLSRQARVYDQLRYLDQTGMEVVRVNYNAGHPAVVPDGELQDKGGRYYFQDAFALDKGGVFVSPLDLNIEHGTLELPYKPMIRFGTPIFDSRGTKRGILLINYLAQDMLDRITDMDLAAPGRSMLVNADGYWLLSSGLEDEWGFMIKDRADRSFSSRYPEAWARIRQGGQGQIMTGEGMFTFTVVRPLRAGQRSSTGSPEAYAPSGADLEAGDYHWFLVSYLSDRKVAQYSRNRLGLAFLRGAGVFAGLALAAWLLALLATRNGIRRARLESLARYDALTGLPNRVLFAERLRLAHEAAKRYDRRYGIVRLDLEGGKPDKEGRGRDLDPELLARVAGNLRAVLRKSDTLARLGGSSLAIVLGELKGPDSARAMAERLVAVLCSPHCLGLEDEGPAASVGTAVYPDHAHDPEELMFLAERALSVAKARGRNASVLASPPASSPA